MKFRIISPRIGIPGNTVTHDELIDRGANIAALISGGFIELVESVKKTEKPATIKTKKPKE